MGFITDYTNNNYNCPCIVVESVICICLSRDVLRWNSINFTHQSLFTALGEYYSKKGYIKWIVWSLKSCLTWCDLSQCQLRLQLWKWKKKKKLGMCLTSAAAPDLTNFIKTFQHECDNIIGTWCSVDSFYIKREWGAHLDYMCPFLPLHCCPSVTFQTLINHSTGGRSLKLVNLSI